MNTLNLIIPGAVLGYILFSVFECMAHKYVLHAKRSTRNSWARLGSLGAYINDSWYAHHVIHHYKTFQTDHVTQFDSAQQEQELNQWLIARGKRSSVLSNHGLRVGNFLEKIRYLYPHLPWITVVCYLGGGEFAIGVLIPLFFYVWVAEHVHPNMHRPHQEAMRIASPLMKHLLNTRYFKALVRHHYLHHKFVDCNFNLMLGADWFLGCHRSPSKAELLEMSDLGLVHLGNPEVFL
jgi:hypothetical protein